MNATAMFAATTKRARDRLGWSSLVFAGLLCGGCQTSVTAGDTAQGQSGAALDRAIGWLHGLCLAIENDALTEGTLFNVVTLGEAQAVEVARIVGPATSPEQCQALTEGRRSTNVAAGYAFYVVESSGSIELEMSIGVMADEQRVAEGRAGVDADRDGVSDYFTACSTSEGVRFSVKSGRSDNAPASSSATLWSGYYYLDYDLKPTCG